jgi:hypothetical protein
MTKPIRPEVVELSKMGVLPASSEVLEKHRDSDLALYENLILSIGKPVTDAEARELIKIFGPDEAFGLAWTLVSLIESAPGWPLYDSLTDSDNEWVALLRQRAKKGQTPLF